MFSAMRGLIIAVVLTCAPAASSAAIKDSRGSQLATAEAFIDAFYSFDETRLRDAMIDARGSMGDIVYYQGWAKGGHYIVLQREPCQLDKPDEVSCAITVKDDIVPVLQTGYDVTDVFHFGFDEGRIVKVWNSSNDPPEYTQAMKWLHRERPEIFTGPCEGIWQGGPTPQDCVRAILKGMKEFMKRPQ